jgi:hypothetical protein
MEMCVHATVATVVLLARRAIVEPDAGRAMIEQTEPVYGPVLEDASRVLDVLGTDGLAGPVRAVCRGSPVPA